MQLFFQFRLVGLWMLAQLLMSRICPPHMPPTSSMIAGRRPKIYPELDGHRHVLPVIADTVNMSNLQTGLSCMRIYGDLLGAVESLNVNIKGSVLSSIYSE
jgi:hypothetical protein